MDNFGYSLFMARKSISDIRKKSGRGRPRVDATAVLVKIPPAQLAVLDAWRAEQDPQPTRPEALRRLAELGLKAKARK